MTAPARRALVQSLGQPLSLAAKEGSPGPAMLGLGDEGADRLAIGHRIRHSRRLFLGRHLQQRIAKLGREAAVEGTREQILVLQDLLQSAIV
jgi:hypothetical protein